MKNYEKSGGQLCSTYILSGACQDIEGDTPRHDW